MNETDPPKAETQDGRVAVKERDENARKALEVADRLYPGHEWVKVEDGIYLSTRRTIGENSGYERELRNAQLLRDLGSTVYLVPERSREKGKKHDAIVDGLIFEFKNTAGNDNTLGALFLASRSQAPNVFINMENSKLAQREIISALYRARNKKTHVNRKGKTVKGYDDSNLFPGGTIILKLKDHKSLIHLDVDNLKLPRG